MSLSSRNRSRDSRDGENSFHALLSAIGKFDVWEPVRGRSAFLLPVDTAMPAPGTAGLVWCFIEDVFSVKPLDNRIFVAGIPENVLVFYWEKFPELYVGGIESWEIKSDCLVHSDKREG
jgi:hypothetical protein